MMTALLDKVTSLIRIGTVYDLSYIASTIDVFSTIKAYCVGGSKVPHISLYAIKLTKIIKILAISHFLRGLAIQLLA